MDFYKDWTMKEIILPILIGLLVQLPLLVYTLSLIYIFEKVK